MVQNLVIAGTTDYSEGIQFTATVNPASFNMFPLLGEIAAGYEKYKFTKLRFIYEGACPTTTSGQVFLTWDPDSQDGVPTSIMDALSMQHTGVVPPYGTTQVVLPSMPDYRYIDESSTTVERLLDHGVLTLVTVGGVGGVPGGFLWVEYSVELVNPQLRPTNSSLLVTKYNTLLASGTRHGPNYVDYVNSNTIRFNTGGYYWLTAVAYNTVGPGAINPIFSPELESVKVAMGYGHAGNPRTMWVYAINVLSGVAANCVVSFPPDVALNGQEFRVSVHRISRQQYNDV